MKSIHIVQILSMYHTDGEDVLNENAKVTKFDTFDEKEIISFLNNNKVDGIILRAPARITPAILDACENVKAISGAGVGLDNIDVDYATKKGIRILHAPKINTNSTAEHAVSLILAVMKNIVKFNDEMEKGNYSYRDGKYTSELKGKTLGLVGFGSISQRVAKIMKHGFEMNVTAYVRRIPEERQKIADAIGVELTKDMGEVFKNSDVISLHIPLNENTDGSIDKTYFDMMKSDAVLINTARGGVINEGDLVAAIKNKQIRAAGVDVFRVEPAPADHPFLGVEEIIKTPHIGGISLEAAKQTSTTIASNLIKAVEGEQLPTIVNWDELSAGE
ncbi:MULTISPECIES: NAD(P)-dependent oxidoreductase [unclassified Oceanobacillus]|uniref:NAD(P)-dependent oxidoreductase n=1 Tax=unclassified Oceanobacillus TaxID=2630292 RepID=UPI001E30D84E|nr:NAD(P)-dependent oxidoreductase [Oceanobacillus sp. AG]